MYLGREGQCQTVLSLTEIIMAYFSEKHDFENLGIGLLVFLPLPGAACLMRSLCSVLVVLVHNRWVTAPWAKQCDIRKVTGGEQGEVLLPAFRITVWHHPISMTSVGSDDFVVNGGTSLSATRGRQLTQYGVAAVAFFFFFSTDKDRVVVGSGGWTGVTRSAGTPWSHWKSHCRLQV